MIVLDASALIAHVVVGDAHHERFDELLARVGGQEFCASVVNLAEALVGPARAGRSAEVQGALDELGIEPVGLAATAQSELAQLRVDTRLSLPDCCVLYAADVAGAEGVLTFDGRLARAAVARGLIDVAGAADEAPPTRADAVDPPSSTPSAAPDPAPSARTGAVDEPLSPGASVEQLFCELVTIPSPSGTEGAVGRAIRAWLEDTGVDAAFDDAGAVNGSDCGNLIATVPGDADAPALLFVAHMDTVESGAEAIAPVLGGDGVIRSAGETILGADNKSAVAAVMRLCRAAATMPAAGRPTVIAAFTCREESGRMGASLLALDELRIDCAFSVDGSLPIGTVITRALGQQVFTIELHGRAAHAAADPGAGINAIAVAGEIVAAMPLGRRPGGGSASIAAIAGGAVIDRLGPGSLRASGVADDADGVTSVRTALDATATNSVPELALLRGELRGYSDAELAAGRSELQAVVARVCERRGARFAWRDRERAVPPFPGAPDSRALALARAAVGDVPGVTFTATAAHATLEANYLAARTDVVALASGGSEPHQFSESITVAELEQLEALLTRIVELAAAR